MSMVPLYGDAKGPVVLAVGNDHHPLPVDCDASARKVDLRLPGYLAHKRTPIPLGLP